MPSEYLSPDEYAAYGLPTGTTVGQVRQASLLIDAALERKKGLIWAPDADGNPCYMVGAPASMAWVTVGAVDAGENVVVTLTKRAPATLVGQPIVFNRAADDAVEACTVVAVDGVTVTLDVVRHAHDAGVSIEAGLFLEHTGQTVGTPSRVFVDAKPVAGVISAKWRSRGGPTGLSAAFDDYGQGLGWGERAIPEPTGAWQTIDIAQIEIDASIGQVCVPCGLYCDVKLHYVAGFSAEGLPAAIKLACAQLILAGSGTAQSAQVVKDIQDAFALRRVRI